MTMYDIVVPVERMAVRRFLLPAPDPPSFPVCVQHLASSDPVAGHLIGVTDGERWGWWGPLTTRVVHDAEWLFGNARAHEPATPEEWGRRLRHGTRHAHTGVLAVAAGAFELACWDLAGQRNDAPVWALTSTLTCSAVPSYATCFGIDPARTDISSIASEVAVRWHVQKWKAVPGQALLCAVAAGAGGDGRLALDFGGAWNPHAARALCERLEFRLAWAEEPYAPDELQFAGGRPFPVPHAAGEHCYSPAETAVLTAAGVSIWQPDAVFCGGYANLRTIVRLARSVAARCLPHGGGLIPSVHAAAAGNEIEIEMVEYHLLLEPRRQAHLAQPILPMNGAEIPVPNRPGWAGSLREGLGEGCG